MLISPTLALWRLEDPRKKKCSVTTSSKRKLHWRVLMKKNWPDRYGRDGRIPTERRGETIIRDIDTTRRNFRMTTRALNP